jgi:hypothetical protein
MARFVFINLRRPTRLDDFSPPQRDQLAVCARLYFGGPEVPLAERFPSDEDEGDPERSFAYFELWDVEVDSAHRYDAVLYNGDSGTVFAAGTTEVVAEMIQCSFCHAREAITAALEDAYHEALAAERARRGTAKKAAKKAAAKRTAKKAAAKRTAKKAAAKRT